MAIHPGQGEVWIAITECFMLSTPDFSISRMPRQMYSPLSASTVHHTLHQSVTSEGTKVSVHRQQGLPFPSGMAPVISVNHEYYPWFLLKNLIPGLIYLVSFGWHPRSLEHHKPVAIIWAGPRLGAALLSHNPGDWSDWSWLFGMSPFSHINDVRTCQSSALRPPSNWAVFQREVLSLSGSPRPLLWGTAGPQVPTVPH